VAGGFATAAISHTTTLSGGAGGTTYVISTGVHPDEVLSDDENRNTHTMVMVEDNAAPDPPIN
jgi:hypothetical protein